MSPRAKIFGELEPYRISVVSKLWLYVTDTSRLPLTDEEQNEGNYIFVTYESMLADIAMHAYLEYGSYDGALYGTKLDTIRHIHADGLIAVIDVEPQVSQIDLSPVIVISVN